MSSDLLELRITALLIAPMMAAAALLSVVTVALLFARARIYGKRVYRPMLLNLALAWIPILSVGVALLFFFTEIEHARWVSLGLMVIWFFFFPNSTYLITEFHHLKEDVTEVPFWFDAVAILSLALSGVILGSFSLLLIHRLIGLYLPWVDAWLAIIGYLFLSNIGIYIGRFLRFNSWDVVAHPFRLARTLTTTAIIKRKEMLLFASLYTVFTLTFYLFLYSAVEPITLLLEALLRNGVGK
ncbi:MAG TPA: DUF1361 domain-containing protein [Ktedonobacterales bacterium]|nr:DUF1361 domain-containing protein [Ktedonobacterales bacterium]